MWLNHSSNSSSSPRRSRPPPISSTFDRPLVLPTTPSPSSPRLPSTSSQLFDFEPPSPHPHSSPAPPSLDHPAPPSRSYQSTRLSSSTSLPSPPPPLDLPRHLFHAGLLNSQLSDIQLICFGRIYRLHRLVLSQVHFFHALLAGAWVDSPSPHSSSQPIPIIFPPQVLRSAFEYCLAQIYGRGPSLVPPPWANLSSEPLLLGRTHALLVRATRQGSVDRNANSVDEDSAWATLLTQPFSQPAPPTFLLSLLVCADYLGMSALAEESMRLIRRTITPFTLVQYLAFAGGQSLDCALDDPQRHSACRSLENISQLAPHLDPSLNPHGPNGFPHESVKESNHESSDSSFCSSSTDGRSDHGQEGLFCHGALAQQIGQACAAWLSKWATELIALEESLVGQDEHALLPPGRAEAEVLECFPWLRRPLLRIWRYPHGLSSPWVRVLVSSDALFLARDICGPQSHAKGGAGGEWERYGLARRVAELRDRERAKGSSTIEPDSELAQMFDDGIYYSHMTFDQLSWIANDTSSITQQKYVATSRLYRAHWLATEFQRKRSLRVGLTQTSEAASSLDDLPLFVVPEDRTSRLDDLKGPARLIDGSFFGLGRDIVRTLPVPSHFPLLTVFEPRRFSAEFVNLARLRDSARLYSLPALDSLSPRTMSYAGSRFSCYLQRVSQSSTADPQLGVYLHRLAKGQVGDNAEDAAATAAIHQLQPSVGTHSLFGQGSRLRSALSSGSRIHSVTSSNDYAGLTSLFPPTATAASTTTSSTSDSNKPPLKAYFVLRVGTIDGTSGTVFESAPDAFVGSQSWGFRSKSMMSSEYLGVSAKAILANSSRVDSEGGVNDDGRQENLMSLVGKFSVVRATAVIGLT